MNKFKIGNRVVVKWTDESDFARGVKDGYTGIVEDDDDCPFVMIKELGKSISLHQDQLELIEDESLQLLRDALKVLNMVPNKVYNGTDFESYQLAGRIQDYLEGKDV